MARKDQIRHQLFLPRGLSDRLEARAAKGRASRSAILAAALASFLEREGASELDRAFATRLDNISRQLARIERDGHILLESLALFIHYMLTVNAPLPEEDETSRAIGRDRFAAFIARVGHRLAGGKRTFEPDEQP